MYAQCFASAFSFMDTEAKHQAGLFSKGLYRLLKLKKQAEKGRVPRSQELLEVAKLISDEQSDQEDETPSRQTAHEAPEEVPEMTRLLSEVRCIEEMMTCVTTVDSDSEDCKRPEVTSTESHADGHAMQANARLSCCVMGCV